MVRGAVEAGRRLERWTDIERLACPTLLIRGERSNDLPRDVFQKMIEVGGSLGGGKIEGVEIANAGHWVHSEQAEMFNAVVDRFLIANNATQ